MKKNKNITYQGSSALFHVVDNLILNREGLSYKINKIYPEDDKSKLNVYNKLRLKQYLFSQISKKYALRIDHYDLLFNKLGKFMVNNFELYGYNLSQDESHYSAYCSIFPKTFVCKKCGHFVSFKKNDEEFNNFDFNHCQLGCGGSYEQIFQVKFCPECGNIEPLNFYCKDHENSIKLYREDKFQPLVWKFGCSICEENNPNYKRVDILRNRCYHKHRSNKEPNRFVPLTAIEGSVYHPVVLTMVDIPNSSIDSLYFDFILLGLYLNKFDDFLIENNITSDDYGEIIKKINDFLKLGENSVAMEVLPQSTIDTINELNNLIEDLMLEFEDYSFVSINDYMVLSGSLSKDIVDSVSYENFIQEDKKLLNDFLAFKNDFKIDQVNYLSNINLVSAVIGVNVGVNKFYEEKFVPHFEPLWDYDRGEGKKFIKSYVSPLETEGLMFNLNKCAVVNWLIDLDKIQIDSYINDENEAIKILMNLSVDSEGYNAVKTLIHTLSHILIRRSSMFTGLDEDSCGEMLFVNSASFLIYSTSNINIGGFSYVFENSLIKWFDEVKVEIKECVLDPHCIQEEGACFSCLYLPEYVCAEFNQFLDRSVLIGDTKRFSKGFWDYE